MYKTVAEARQFAEQLGRRSTDLAAVSDYAVCPPFTALQTLRVILPTAVALGAQNVHPEANGAYTGEISVAMLAELGVSYVIVGHSERRALFDEGDEFVAQKVASVLQAGLIPILCVGENQAQRERGQAFEVVARQTQAALADVAGDALAGLVIAYEPVWAIGSGHTPTPVDAQQVISHIRSVVADSKGAAGAVSVRILYGGSVKPTNIDDFTHQPDIDGALVGGASLAADSFADMALAMNGRVRG
jgi:triosephosphate isomerase